MKYIHANCDFCGKPVVRNAALCKYANVKRHFCNLDCKAAFQKLSKPVTKEWLYEQYITLGRNCTQIALEVGRDPKSVWSWLKDFGIPTRSRGGHTMPHAFKKGEPNLFQGRKHTPETRKRMSEYAKATGRVPYDPAVGSYALTHKGPDHPSWKGGITPERLSFYSTKEWKDAERAVKKRDKNTCQRCGSIKIRGDGQSFDVHHKVGFVCVSLRATVSNLVYLCEPCHYWVHSKENINRDFIEEVSS